MIQFENTTFAYPQGAFRLHVPALRVGRGEKVVVIGPSGAGKTTLLHLAAGILPPREGSIRVDGLELSGLSDAARRNFRIRNVGMVFQEFELLEYLSVRENILLPYRVNRSLKLDAAVRRSVASLAEAVGIGDTLDRYPERLSQGERQRVAICRVLVTKAPLIVADEPTGNLDPNSSRTILDLLLGRADAGGATLLTVTHDHSLLDRFDRVIDFERLHAETTDAGAAS